ncbi:signal transduction histidine kinase [Dysgonomonas sp. PFB1-18]|uniref:sensor histidine kinase n=1 Tax=unclassified Dysgonomonas TaxID=2630389 RepID=UPI002473E5DE|nr:MULTISPECIES: HAMP domain-containing sensor histidine kinase [unclassified Dysgonomonas]MDL2303050.1 HAMP domain-containing histidine kinase [Dysgonomonas sp. OttesenSCG-928-D17]MDH6310141.1 signal transduction histidine kinase [Dysgonomonas sp. PF1-14]MDH6340193.1 signal transduction histidine kinase [Dysgonomonas sp. PF1-16]MDH6381698.1 signal transduction histidine kinase [Dysgonomonas sp. PFB1-18]MDH6399057.1 signal transduction histidine kinase [Dysgonomonas sp. PF1-23]
MKSLSFRNRIALNYIITTALLIGLVFVTIYVVVEFNVSGHLNEDLQREVDRHSNEIEIKDEKIALKRHKEWMEREHNTVGVDPVFIEFLDLEGNLIDKSPNLKESHLLYDSAQPDNVFYNGELAEKRIRQVQVPILDKNGKRVGHLLVAVAREGSEVVLETLRHILLITYPIILIILFFVARFIAGRSIKPINEIINTSNKITRDNLTERIPLPHNKDELYILSDTINNLLDRIEKAIEREKSFTSYASHEFRTPLAVLKGTLEVLIRKPRQQEEYEEKVKYCVKEIDRLNHLVDELLILTRYENQKRSLKLENISIKQVIEETLKFFSENIEQKNIHINTEISSENITLKTDIYLFSTIINNILSNAIKYSHQGGDIEIKVNEKDKSVFCEIKDSGIGIPQKDREKVFDKFYRSTDHSNIKGFGLGLPIVKRFCSLLNIRVEIFSKESVGTTIRLQIPQS